MRVSINLDLISVGIAVAAIAILGFAVFFNNRKSVTSRAFLLFSLVSVFWSIVNYLQYQTHFPSVSFLILRLVIFLGVWHSFSFFQFCFVFPEEETTLPKWYKFFYVPLVILASITALTQFVFARIAEIASDGSLLRVDNGPAIPLVALLILCSVAGGIGLLIWKTIKASPERQRQFRLVMFGMITTFLLLMAGNFLLPAFFAITRFIPLGAIFLLPFVAATFYSISKYHLLNMKVISTEILAFVLSIATLLEVMISQGVLELILRASIFTLVLIFSIFLICSVRREVEQREELERLNRELEDAKLKLEDLNKFKMQLLSLASHQVKSPLAAIKGFATLLTQGLYGTMEPKIKETVDKIYNSADGLLALINTLLDVRKVEEGRMDYQFAKTDLALLVGGIMGEIQPLADQKKLALSYEGPKDSVYVNADSLKLKQVVQNLIDNAIKYTPSGFVKVSLTVDGSMAKVTVSDSGLGIPADLTPHLFEEFIRDERVKQKILGTGLGLFIAKKIVEAHGGVISATSDGEGKGSTFTVTLKTLAE